MENTVVAAYGDLGAFLTREELSRLAEVKAQESRDDPKTLLLVVAAQDDKAKAPRMLITGKVTQKIPEGLLVDSGGAAMRKAENDAIRKGFYGAKITLGKKRGLQIYVGLCLLREHPDYARLVDDDEVEIAAIETGEFVYKTVMGATKTIRSFEAYPTNP